MSRSALIDLFTHVGGDPPRERRHVCSMKAVACLDSARGLASIPTEAATQKSSADGNRALPCTSTPFPEQFAAGGRQE